MVRTGLERAISEQLHVLKQRRVGLVTHPAAVLPDYTHSIQALISAGANVCALFGPEHGLLGAAADGAKVADSRDPRTGLPVFSLYGSTRTPGSEMLQGLDVLVFDMQDVGVRFYTFISTLVNILAGASAAGLPVIVLDRPNPLGGLELEGPILEPGFESFVGALTLPIQHGLTTGELARLAVAQKKIDIDLTVEPMEGWRRSTSFAETGLPWVITSPAIPHLSSVVFYPGMCFIEGTNLSEGRGTALPFEVCGAPWVDAWQLADELNLRGLPGVHFRPAAFTPTASKHAGQVCMGVQVHVTQPQSFQAVRAGLELISACQKLSPGNFKFLMSSWEGRPAHFDLLAGSAKLRNQLASGISVEEIVSGWRPGLQQFQDERRNILLYD